MIQKDIDTLSNNIELYNFYNKEIPFGIVDIQNNYLKNKNYYLYNNYGYRTNIENDKLDLNKKDKIFCFGCSFTFGLGNKYEETWPHFLSRYFSNYNIYNFGVNGSSIASIVRRIYQFIKNIEYNNFEYPEYVIIYFPDFYREEQISHYEGMVVTKKWGSWNLNKDLLKYIKKKETMNTFFYFVKHFTFIDEILSKRNIKWYWSSWHPEYSLITKKLINYYLKNNTFLDKDNNVVLCPVLDRSTEGNHFGPKTNAKLASLFYEIIQKNT
jgi:hypothetical protein